MSESHYLLNPRTNPPGALVHSSTAEGQEGDAQVEHPYSPNPKSAAQGLLHLGEF